MDAFTAIVVLVLIGLVLFVGTRERPAPRALIRDERAWARAHLTEECALCDVDIYVWQGRFLHVANDQPEYSTPHGAPHRAMPWAVYQELWQELKDDETQMFVAFNEPKPVWDRDGLIGLIAKCPGCLMRHRIKVDRAKYMSWKAGKPMVQAFPGATAREVAMAERGWHPTCYDEWWGKIRREEFEEIVT